jgi:restriction system protein
MSQVEHHVGERVMTIPDYQTLMRPVLEALADGEERATAVLRNKVAQRLNLTDEDLRHLVPSGQKPLFHDRTSWAISYLTQAAAVERAKRGVYKITERGKMLLHRPGRVDNEVLNQFDEFRAFLNRSAGDGRRQRSKPTSAEPETPDESLETAYVRLRTAIEAELLQQVTSASPAFLERLVVQLLVAMGYGGSLKDAGQAIGRSGDGGIDGIIKEDRLGLDVIHVQAKRWEKTVGRPEVQSFAGSLDGVRAKKGIFITTASFSGDARTYVDRIDKRIVLVDGAELVAMMYEFGVGVTPTAVYAVKRVDTDYFSEE